MTNNYDWLIHKTPRSVDQLRLWPENPRLNPEETHLTLKEYAEDLTLEKAEKRDFFELVNSIVDDGFVPADPVVVWQNEDNKKYYVAEGNRRVIALKLLREPDKAPKSIRSFIRNASSKIDITSIEKIPVNVAPSFDHAEWYINQRNSSSTLQRKWSRVQQQRWIVSLYQKHNGNLDRILSVTKLSKSEIEGIIRTLKIKDFVKLDNVKEKLTTEEFELADSYRFPITILERFFSFADVKEKWGVEYNGLDVNIISNKESFYNAFSELIKRIVNNNEDDKINTRLKKEHLEEVLESLPTVSFDYIENENFKEGYDSSNVTSNNTMFNDEPSEEENEDDAQIHPAPNPINHLKGNPNRNRILLDIYTLNTDSYRLHGLFKELKIIPIHKYPNHVSSSLRVFLDLAVLKYIETEDLTASICSEYNCGLREIALKKRLEFIKTNYADNNVKAKLNKFLNSNEEFSLDVLNGYIHSQDTHYTEKKFLNRFWDFLFPIFEFLLEIRED